jgi:hypothetical protein
MLSAELFYNTPVHATGSQCIRVLIAHSLRARSQVTRSWDYGLLVYDSNLY